MTAVEELRRAAALMRAQQGEFWDALADWLDNAADWHGVAAFDESPAARHALAVARAYLGGQP